MHKLFYWVLTLTLVVPSFAWSKVNAPEFELVVVENVPENVNLNMNINEIIDAKHGSQLHKNKSRIYGVLTKRLSPLLSSTEFADGYNLFDLAKQIPAQIILDEIMRDAEVNSTPSDFMILILPKIPDSQKHNNLYHYAPLYAQNKAAVIDYSKAGFRPGKSFNDLLNDRVTKAINYSYQYNYVEEANNEAFFVGVLGHIHLESGQTSAKFQVVGGMPTDITKPFEQIEKEVHFTHFRAPETPKPRLFVDSLTNHPGVIIELLHQPSAKTPVKLKVNFGSLGLIEGTEWVMKDQLTDFDKVTLGTDGFAVARIHGTYNVPHLFGVFKDPVGTPEVNYQWDPRTWWSGIIAPGLQMNANAWLRRDYNVKMNIHEVVIDLENMVIEDMRVSVQLPLKDHIWIGGLVLPTFEVPSVTQKFKDAGNQQLKPIQDQLINMKKKGIANFLLDPEVQTAILDQVNQIVENNKGVL